MTDAFHADRGPVKARWKRWLFRAAQLAVIVVVIWGLVRAINKARRELAEHQQRWQTAWDKTVRQLEAPQLTPPQRAQILAEQAQLRRGRIDWRNMEAGWLLVSGLFYAGSVLIGWGYWLAVLQRMHQRPQGWTSFRAYAIGNLGKYIPGKAMVVVLRTGLVQGPSVAVWAAAAGVFIETLTYMAVGAAVGSLLIPFLPWASTMSRKIAVPTAIAVLCVLLATALGFGYGVRSLLRRRDSLQLRQAMQGLDGRLLCQGGAVFFVAWVLVGMSFWAAARALPGEARPWSESLTDLPTLTAVAAWAVVLGFFTFLPGGLGVRELVIGAALAPHPAYGSYRALALAVVVRVVWLAVELALALIACLPVASRHPPAAPHTVN